MAALAAPDTGAWAASGAGRAGTATGVRGFTSGADNTHMTEPPLVSVVICVYNARAYLRDAVTSVLEQTLGNLEILIIDDGSTDGCVEMLADLSDPRIRVLRQENQGKPVALNRALNEMRGEFYAIQDADDLSHPQRIERQLRCMLGNSDLAAVFCGNDLIVGEERLAPRFGAKTREQCAN